MTTEIHTRESYRKLYQVTGFLCLVAGLVFLLLGSSGGLLLGLGVLQLWMAVRAANIPIIRITRDYLEIKLAPLASKQFVSFDEIRRVGKTTRSSCSTPA